MRRFKAQLPWVSALALLVFLGNHYSNTANVSPEAATDSRIVAQARVKNIPFPKAAWRVAREFAFTGVGRKDLAKAYSIAHPELKGGITLREWNKGQLPVPFIPVAEILKYNWKNSNYVHQRDAQINVILIPTKSSHMMPVQAVIGLTKVGEGSHARWLVSYYAPLTAPSVPAPS